MDWLQIDHEEDAEDRQHDLRTGRIVAHAVIEALLFGVFGAKETDEAPADGDDPAGECCGDDGCAEGVARPLRPEDYDTGGPEDTYNPWNDFSRCTSTAMIDELQRRGMLSAADGRPYGKVPQQDLVDELCRRGYFKPEEPAENPYPDAEPTTPYNLGIPGGP